MTKAGQTYLFTVIGIHNPFSVLKKKKLSRDIKLSFSLAFKRENVRRPPKNVVETRMAKILFGMTFAFLSLFCGKRIFHAKVKFLFSGFEE